MIGIRPVAGGSVSGCRRHMALPARDRGLAHILSGLIIEDVGFSDRLSFLRQTGEACIPESAPACMFPTN
jgi:hypothetical protein